MHFKVTAIYRFFVGISIGILFLCKTSQKTSFAKF